MRRSVVPVPNKWPSILGIELFDPLRFDSLRARLNFHFEHRFVSHTESDTLPTALLGRPCHIWLAAIWLAAISGWPCHPDASNYFVGPKNPVLWVFVVVETEYAIELAEK